MRIRVNNSKIAAIASILVHLLLFASVIYCHAEEPIDHDYDENYGSVFISDRR
ncbi:MAG: hypothetical protein H6619_05100 [Deltaproteobacteria bacterium]|nr:hypothetical protein [Deltaproteobacteria bacterium]